MNAITQEILFTASDEIDSIAAQLEKMAREIDSVNPNFAFRLDNNVMRLQRLAITVCESGID